MLCNRDMNIAFVIFVLFHSPVALNSGSGPITFIHSGTGIFTDTYGDFAKMLLSPGEMDGVTRIAP